MNKTIISKEELEYLAKIFPKMTVLEYIKHKEQWK